MNNPSYILGLPIETDIGLLYPTKVKDYAEFQKHNTLLLKQDFEFKEELAEMVQDDKFNELLESSHIFDFVRRIRATFSLEDNYFSFLYEGFREMFKFHFKEDVIEKVKDSEDFEYYRDLIMKVNAVEYEKPNPNPEIQGAIELKREIDRKKGQSVSFESVVTSVALMYSTNVNELTLYQLYAYFERAVKLTTYETSRIYRIFSEDIKIEEWYTDIKKKKREEYTISQEEIDGVNDIQVEELSPIEIKRN